MAFPIRHGVSLGSVWLQRSAGWGLIAALGLPVTACSRLATGKAQPQPDGQSQAGQPIAVDAIAAQPGSVTPTLDYTGTTRPQRQITLRPQIDGRLTDLSVDIGDSVSQGDLLAQLDRNLLQVEVNEAKAELGARQSEAAAAAAQVSEAKTAVEQAQATLRQAQADAQRLRRLAAAGAIPQQEAEQAELAAATAQQALYSAQEQLQAQRQVVNANRGRVDSQQAVVGQTQERLAFTTLRAPFDGVVLQRLVEPGDYVPSGAEILQIGDLSSLKVVLAVSELDLSQIQPGQATQIRLDAFPDQTFSGRVSRIAPLAELPSRQVTVEVTMANPAGRIGSGLLARVRLEPETAETIVIPPEALEQAAAAEATVFVVTQVQTNPRVEAREVELGRQSNGQVEVVSGLSAGDTVVVRSERPLAAGQPVRLSLLSDL